MIILVVGLIVLSLTVRQVYQEEKQLTTDIQYRTTILAERFRSRIAGYTINENHEELREFINAVTSEERLEGILVYDNKGRLLASSLDLLEDESAVIEDSVSRAMDGDKTTGDFVSILNKKNYLLAVPLRNEERIIGAMAVLQNASYIDTTLSEIWMNNLLYIFLQIIILSVIIMLILRWIIYTPIGGLVDSIKLIRLGGKPEILGSNFFFKPLLQEISYLSRSLFEARAMASEEARLRLAKVDSPWTSQRLQEFIKAVLKNRTIFIVSNREPYIHVKNGNKIDFYQPASGMVTAIESMMKASGGIWIAHGSGNADKLTVDSQDKIAVPPDEPKYSLKRVWLTEEEEKGYYYGFANEGIWPLCHMAHTRPTFRKEDWKAYEKVNGKFAHALLKEIKDVHRPIIIIQDYHFALLPRMLRKSRPDALVGIFWHIPWPNSEAFSICPWRKELLEGMLGADLIGFHTQLYCNNFIDTVRRELEAQVNRERFAITKEGHVSHVRPLPISVPFGTNGDNKQITEEEKKKALEKLGVNAKFIGLGVERLDYTKGIPERLWGIDRFLTNHPKYKEKFTYIQIAAPTRSVIPEYKKIAEIVEAEAAAINKKHATKNWKPIVLLEKHHSHEEINKYYQLANVCLVTSLHDGMNLVAKEFVSARSDELGVLILSQFAGAATELSRAIIINPYDTEQVAEAVKQSLEMMPSEQKKRMRKMRENVKKNNIYRWSAELLRQLVDIEA